MWSKIVLRATRIGYSANIRCSRHVQSLSYLQGPRTEPLIQATYGQVFEDTVNKYPDRIAVRSIYEDVSLTYEQILKQADTLGCALRAQGLEKGDRVGIWSHNNSAWLIAAIAAARAGLIAVAINPVYEKNELDFCINKTGIKSLLIGERLANREYYRLLCTLLPELPSSKPGFLQSKACPSLISVITSGKDKLPGTFTLDSLIAEYSDNEITKYGSEIAPEDGSIIHFTSGTTGDPKAALDSHHAIVNNTYFVGKRTTMHEGHQTVCLQTPLFHALASVITAMAAFRHGSTLVIPSPTYNVAANLNALVAEKCSIITGTPTMYVDMLSACAKDAPPPTNLRVALAAGAPCSPKLIRDMKSQLNAQKVLGLFGMTEVTASIFQSLPEDSIDLVAETVGYIMDHVEVKVVDENGKQVPFGCAGELLSRGYNNMIGYWDEPEKTRQTIDKDGWLSTGDKLTISEDGYGRVVGRLKDIIVRGGENIAPKEVEDLLNTHPDVIESQVIGVSDERLGEELCAVLRVRENATITPQDISKFCSGKLARFKIPRLLKITQEFPKTGSGKIQKFKLKELVESGKL